MRITLQELGHEQPPTPIHIDNTTCVGIVNNSQKRTRSRAMENKYFWLLDGEAQKQFKFLHHPGQENLGDYPSKADPEPSTNMYGPTTYKWTPHQLSCQEQLHPALGEGVLKPWMIPITEESHYPGLQVTESWTEKPNSPIWYTTNLGSRPYYGTHYLYPETSLALPIMITSTTSDEYTTHIASNSLYS